MLAFHESVTEWAFGLTGDDPWPSGELDEVGAQGGTTCPGVGASAVPMVGAGGGCLLTWAISPVAREAINTSMVPKILIGFEEYLTEVFAFWI
jgi:hypothetical protein